MNQFTRPDRFACELGAPVRDDFVRVCVCARTRACLKNVERKMVVELSFDDFLGCLHDQRCALRVEQTEIMVGLRASPFDQAECANKRTRKPITAHGKIKYRPVSRGAVKSGRWKGHLAHRILFYTLRPVLRHAGRSAPANSESFRAVRYSQSLSDCADCAF